MASKPHVQREEGDLIRRICAGEHELFYALIEPYQRAVYATALGVVSNPADAEDVTQEALLKALRGLSGFRAEAKFSTWLIQIAFNEGRMFLRRSRHKLFQSLDLGQEMPDGDYIPRDFADWREIPSEALDRKELRRTLTREIAAMRPIYREVLILRDMRQMSVREAADVLGISESVVKTRLLRARLQLRDALAPGYDGCWTHEAKGRQKVRPW